MHDSTGEPDFLIKKEFCACSAKLGRGELTFARVRSLPWGSCSVVLPVGVTPGRVIPEELCWSSSVSEEHSIFSRVIFSS